MEYTVTIGSSGMMEVVPEGRLEFDLYKGCGYNCSYCYCPEKFGVSRTEWGKVEPVDGILETITKAVTGKSGSSVSLSPYSDLYTSGIDTSVTREALRIIVEHGCRPCITTKGGTAIRRDLDLLKAGKAFVVLTMTFFEPGLSERYEPGVPLPADRINALKEAKKAGLQTGINIDPMLTRGQLTEAPRILYATMGFVDFVEINAEPLKGIKPYEVKSMAIDWWESYCRDRAEMVINTANRFLRITSDGISREGTCEAR
jgi:DNA repair photolyase